jgi:hypothetical protein
VTADEPPADDPPAVPQPPPVPHDVWPVAPPPSVAVAISPPHAAIDSAATAKRMAPLIRVPYALLARRAKERKPPDAPPRRLRGKLPLGA